MRGKQAPKRELAPDRKYGSPFVTKLINYVMMDGKKSVAERVVYDAFVYMEDKTKKPAMDIFNLAIKNGAPSVEVKSRRVGGANYQVPIPVRGDRRYALVYRWMLEAARKAKGKPMAIRLANELMAMAENEGPTIKKKQDVQRMAEANRAFAHFARR
ncbi:MAG: 30S ribosomal protein S7 [bacterium]|nr:30S ribosomal protein S7 [bacterium]MDA1024358.1 30S ribosomal protein S7 [bacterium]